MKDLEQLASETFAKVVGPLSEGERQLLKAAQSGTVADCVPDENRGPSDEDPAQYEKWDKERRVRASLIRWICRNEEVRSLVDPRGIAVEGAIIVRPLDISNQIVPFPLQFIRCAAPSRIALSFADLKVLNLEGSWISSLFAERIVVQGDVSLSNKFSSNGEIRLTGAKIGGNLDCSGGRFLNRRGIALTASRAEIGGSVMLCSNFEAEGLVRFVGAKINGDLDCGGGHFSNPTRASLHAEDAEVGGSVMLCEATVAEGLLQIVGARTGGDQFIRNALQRAQRVMGGKAEKSDLDELITRFESNGEVVLNRIKAAGDVDCTGGRFVNAEGCSLSLAGARITGSVKCCVGTRSRFESVGEMNLQRADIGRDLICIGADFRESDHQPPSVERKEVSEQQSETASIAFSGNALNAEDAEISGSILLDSAYCEGAVRLMGAKIGDQLSCNGIFLNPGKDSVAATALRTGGSVIFGKPFGGGLVQSISLPVVAGVLRFLGARIGGDLAIDVSFRDQDPNGVVAQASTVEGWLIWGSGWINDHTILDLRDTTVGSLVLKEEKSWPRKGNLELQGLIYDGIEWERSLEAVLRRESTVETALRWLDLQPYFSSQPYQQLARVLRERGNEADAKAVLIRKESARRKYGKLGVGGRIWSWVLNATIGYGYKPQRALYIALVIVAFGSLLAYGGQRFDLMEQSKPESKSYAPLAPIVYSADVFLPIVNLRQKDYWWPDATRGCKNSMLGRDLAWPCGSLLRVYLWLHTLAGWVLTTLFAAGLAGLVRKD